MYISCHGGLAATGVMPRSQICASPGTLRNKYARRAKCAQRLGRIGRTRASPGSAGNCRNDPAHTMAHAQANGTALPHSTHPTALTNWPTPRLHRPCTHTHTRPEDVDYHFGSGRSADARRKTKHRGQELRPHLSSRKVELRNSHHQEDNASSRRLAKGRSWPQAIAEHPPRYGRRTPMKRSIWPCCIALDPSRPEP